ncbi:MAG TPA: CPBP family intramembrane glutamic endopeptidase [Drouetiella sp.]|jgi:membrane protease YdiL (CAAX protease family)
MANQPPAHQERSLNAPMIYALCLLPCAAMWYGLYIVKNTNTTLALYHGLCLLPAIAFASKLWRSDFMLPTKMQTLVLVLVTVVFNASTLFLYDHLGYLFLSNDKVMVLLTELGFKKGHLLALSLYFIFVNSTLEELFWRGTILNQLDRMHPKSKHFGIILSSVMYAAFHYLILRLVVYPGWAEIGFLMLAIYGWMLAALYRKTGSILMPILAHAFLTDLVAMLLTVDLLSRYSG